MEKRLYRSETDRMIAGVCAGFAEYFNIDPAVVRIVFLLFVLWGGGGVLAYIICWIVVPTESSIETDSEKVIKENSQEIKETVSKTAKGLKTEVKSDTKKEEKNEK
jgi:phage shock protein PspC (stress-responsive transcriptional regulator)